MFTIISILIACLGLYGLASYYTVQRTKEVGIRKVMGAAKWQIIYLFFKEISLRILIAILIGAPIALILTNNWLKNFVYKTEINWWIIPLTGVFTLLVAWITVVYQTNKAARKNPVEALRYE
jgi:putative ABC transport system permease protein